MERIPVPLRRLGGKVWNDVSETETSICGFLRVQAHVRGRTALHVVHRATHLSRDRCWMILVTPKIFLRFVSCTGSVLADWISSCTYKLPSSSSAHRRKAFFRHGTEQNAEVVFWGNFPISRQFQIFILLLRQRHCPNYNLT